MCIRGAARAFLFVFFFVLFSAGLTKYRWDEKKVVTDWFIKACLLRCRQVYDLVLAFKAGNLKINRCCQRIRSCILLDIEKKRVYEKKEFEDRQRAHHERMQSHLLTLHEEIVETLKSMYMMFHGHPKNVQAAWLQYVREKDKLVQASLLECARRSLIEFSRAVNGDAKNEVT